MSNPSRARCTLQAARAFRSDESPLQRRRRDMRGGGAPSVCSPHERKGDAKRVVHEMRGTRLGAFDLLSELGSGGMGTVWLAEVIGDESVVPRGTRVAVKVVHPHLLAQPGFFKRFMREAEVGRQVDHENVVRTFDVDALEVDGKTTHFLVMEYVRGRTLREMLRDLGTVPEALLREIARQAGVEGGTDLSRFVGRGVCCIWDEEGRFEKARIGTSGVRRLRSSDCDPLRLRQRLALLLLVCHFCPIPSRPTH